MMLSSLTLIPEQNLNAIPADRLRTVWNAL